MIFIYNMEEEWFRVRVNLKSEVWLFVNIESE